MFAKSNKVNQEYIKFENAMKEMMNKSLNDKHIQMIRRNKQLQLFIKKSFLIESITSTKPPRPRRVPQRRTRRTKPL